MKKIIAFAFVALFVIGAQNTLLAQIRKVPAAVTEAFKQKYPSASNVEWKDKVTLFMASYEQDGKKHEARFTSKGEWKSTETEVGEAGLPAAVKDGFDKSKYDSEWTIQNGYKIELPGEDVQYRVHIKKNDVQKKNLLFSKEGKLLKDNITI